MTLTRSLLHVHVIMPWPLSRGRFYINGMDLGRFWSKICGSDLCQRFYPIPFDILKPAPASNTLTVLDELGVTNVSSVGLAVSTDVEAPPCTRPAAPGDNASTVLCGSAGASLTIKPVAGGLSVVSLHRSPSLCLTAAPESKPSSAVWTECSAGSAAQQWGVWSGTVKPAADAALCLDITGQQRGTGVVIDVWRCNGGANQQWSVNGDSLVSGFGEVCVGYACSLRR